MAQKKYDGVIEAIRYTPEGQISMVRAYERRGATFSDVLLRTRLELLEWLKTGKKIAVGTRQHLMASTFDIKNEVRLAGARGREVIISGKLNADRDQLQGVPLF